MRDSIFYLDYGDDDDDVINISVLIYYHPKMSLERAVKWIDKTGIYHHQFRWKRQILQSYTVFMQVPQT